MTLLLKYLQNDLIHHRKELIKFGWNHLKREDNSIKQWTFVNVCHFLVLSSSWKDYFTGITSNSLRIIVYSCHFLMPGYKCDIIFPRSSSLCYGHANQRISYWWSKLSLFTCLPFREDFLLVIAACRYGSDTPRKSLWRRGIQFQTWFTYSSLLFAMQTFFIVAESRWLLS